MSQLITFFGMLFISTSALAGQTGEMALVTDVLKGDTIVVSIRGHLGEEGTGLIVHVAGVDAPELTQAGGTGSKAYLSSLCLNQKVNVTSVLKSPDGSHAIARVRLGENGSGQDVGADILQNGWGFYRSDERNGLNALQGGTYPGIMQQAKYGKKGLWATGEQAYTMTPSSFRNLQMWKYTEQYVNGAKDPSQAGFDRPQSNEHVPTGPGDWRSYSHHLQPSQVQPSQTPPSQ